MTLGGEQLVAFVATADRARAREFYGQTLGLPLLDETQFAWVFRAGATTLRVTFADEVSPAPYTVLGWVVADLDAVLGALLDSGVEFVRYEGLEHDERAIWRAPGGARIVWFKDPDGNTLSLTQASH